MDTYPSIDITECLDHAIAAAKEGGKILMQHWGRLSDVREKSHAGDLVSEADNRSEDVILAYLKKQYPGHTLLSEESGFHTVKDADYLWAIDPLDGTTNFTHQVPIFAVSIALLYQGQPIVGVVYNPFFHELFTAARGKGAALNGKPIRVSQVKELRQSLLASGFAYDRRETPDNNYAEFCILTSLTQGVRRMGAAALDLAYVAAGRIDGFWERGLNIWDIAAGVVLVEEAGGRVSSYENKEILLDSGRILASNGSLHQAMSDSLQQVPGKMKPIIPHLFGQGV